MSRISAKPAAVPSVFHSSCPPVPFLSDAMRVILGA